MIPKISLFSFIQCNKIGKSKTVNLQVKKNTFLTDIKLDESKLQNQKKKLYLCFANQNVQTSKYILNDNSIIDVYFFFNIYRGHSRQNNILSKSSSRLVKIKNINLRIKLSTEYQNKLRSNF